MSSQKTRIVFVVPDLGASHFKNRILGFISQGYEVCVYGYERFNRKLDLPYQFHSLGVVTRKRYLDRIRLYVRTLGSIKRPFRKEKVVYYLGNLDIAMFFHFLHPFTPYIYEECDLSHTYSSKMTSLLEIIDRLIIHRSLLMVTTSEGFIRYHFGNRVPDNVCLLENKLNPDVLKYPSSRKRAFDKGSVTVGFVGGPRFESVHHFIEVFCRRFPKYEFHVFGGPVLEEFEDLKSVQNCYFHGYFSNPIDLPDIYSAIDLLLCTYPLSIENVKYAEPNKLYESIFYEKPIVVSKGTFLEEKVIRLGIGYSIDAMDEEEIVSFVNELDESDLQKKINNASAIDKNSLIESNKDFFARLEQKLA